MPLDLLPLAAHPSFRAATLDCLSEEVEKRLAAKVVQAGERRLATEAAGNRFELASTVLWACSYGRPVRLKFLEGPYLRVQFARHGVGATHTREGAIEVSSGQSCVYSAAAEIDFGSDFRQVAWRVPMTVLEEKLAALTGSPIVRRLEFEAALNLETSPARAMLSVLDSLLESIDAAPGALGQLIRAELESALLVSLLCSSRHNYSERLDGTAPSPAPWQVRRAESFIEANWDKPIAMEDIVAATGVSARSLFRAFRRSRGYTPLQFVKELRLRQAQRLLSQRPPGLTITEVALTCGFCDLSRFSKDFSRAFGVSPSGLLRRSEAHRKSER